MSFIYLFLLFILCFFLQTIPIQAQEKAEPVKTIHGSEDYAFSYPTSLFLDYSSKRVYAADGGRNVLLLFDKDLEFLADFDNDGQMETPLSSVKDSKGRFYVSEAGSRRLMFFDLDAEVSKPLELGEGVVPGPLSIDKKDNLYVINRIKGSIFKFSTDGTVTSEIQVQGKQLRFTDVWVGEDGMVYGVDPIARQVFVFDQSGKLLLSFGKKGDKKGELLFPVSVCTTENIIMVVDSHRKKVLSFDKQGRFITEFGNDGLDAGQLSSPIFVRVDWEKRIFVINRDPPKIEVFRLSPEK